MRTYLELNCDNATIADGKLRKYRGDAIHIKIPDDVHTILAPAFTEKMKIQSLFFGKKMKDFRSNRAYLEHYETDPENPYYTAIDGVLFDKKAEVLLDYPCAKKDTFYRVPDHVKEIKSTAFSRNPHLNELEIAGSVLRIGESAFSHCSNLEKVVLPDKLVNIERNLFWETNLKEIVIPATVTKIGEWAFRNNRQLQHVVLPRNLQEIQEHAFSDCENLTSIEFPASLTKIARHAFQNTGLRSVVFPEGICEIAEYSFAKCLNLTEAKLPSTPHVVDGWAFAHCENLTPIVSDKFKYDNIIFWGCKDPIYVKYVAEAEETEEDEERIKSQEQHAALDETMKQLNAVLEMYETLYNQVPPQQRKNAEMITEHRRRHIQDILNLDEEIAKLSMDVVSCQIKIRECGHALWGENAKKRKQYKELLKQTQENLRMKKARRKTALFLLHKIPSKPVCCYACLGHVIWLYPTNQLDATFAIDYDGELLVYNACELSLADDTVDVGMDASELDRAIMTGIAAGSFAGYVATQAAQTYGIIKEVSLTLLNQEDSSYKKLVFAENVKLNSSEYSRFSAEYSQFAGTFGNMMRNISRDEVGAHELIKNGLVSCSCQDTDYHTAADSQ